jgi:hypothetical protein
MDDSCLAIVDFPFPGFPKIRIRGLTGTSGRIIPARTNGLDENIFAILGFWSHRLPSTWSHVGETSHEAWWAWTYRICLSRIP